jgi:hypothetical protein
MQISGSKILPNAWCSHLSVSEARREQPVGIDLIALTVLDCKQELNWKVISRSPCGIWRD